ncbi:MAG: HD domain-containing protein [Lachnospiraceae bacterium]|nr:HD domain-containing protein [Lachnospiraceae bacterium]
MAQKNYENIDIYYWSIVIIIPIVILGYWLKTRATTVEGAKFTFAFIYLDSTVLLTVMLFAMIRFIGVRVKSWIKVIIYSITMGHLFMIWMCLQNDLYYKKMTLIDTGMGTATKMLNGQFKFIHWIYLAIMILAIVVVGIIALIKRGTYSKRSLILYTVITITGLVMYVVETVHSVDFSYLPLLYVVADLAIASEYDRIHTHDIAIIISEQEKRESVNGYIAFDLKGRFLSCNDKAYEFLPDLKNQVVDAKIPLDTDMADIFYELIEDYERGIKRDERINKEDFIYNCEINEFTIRKDERVQGYLFEIRDVTKEQNMLDMVNDYNENLNAEVTKKTENIRQIQQRVVLGLANMVENRDDNTGGHVKRTSDIVKYIVEEMVRQNVYKFDEMFATDVIRAAPMHDLGKITIDNSILLKPGRFTPEEYEIMKTHSVKSGEIVSIILKDVEEDHFAEVAFNVARFHHERWDGKGYPEGLVGEMIPLEARIMAVADVYDALVSKRCYKEAMDFERAADIMTEGMGTQFDPNMLSVFIGCRQKLEQYYS